MNGHAHRHRRAVPTTTSSHRHRHQLPLRIVRHHNRLLPTADHRLTAIIGLRHVRLLLLRLLRRLLAVLGWRQLRVAAACALALGCLQLTGVHLITAHLPLPLRVRRDLTVRRRVVLRRRVSVNGLRGGRAGLHVHHHRLTLHRERRRGVRDLQQEKGGQGGRRQCTVWGMGGASSAE